jgi:hypothetical protein
MSLFVKIRTISGRNAITVMIAPSWFCTKNRTVSCFEAGSRRFAFFHRYEPPMASAPTSTITTISSHVFTGS